MKHDLPTGYLTMWVPQIPLIYISELHEFVDRRILGLWNFKMFGLNAFVGRLITTGVAQS